MTGQTGLEKNRLRVDARRRRTAFAAAEGADRWAPTAECLDRLVGRSEFGRGVTLASYRPKGSEADPAPIDALAAEAQMTLCYPRIDADGEMRFYAIGPSGGIVRDSYGIAVPATDGRLERPSVILVPLLAFDRYGTRLGQGGGHYDRALSAIEARLVDQGRRLVKIGIAWSIQEMPNLPCDPWDVPLDAVMTEKEWIAI